MVLALVNSKGILTAQIKEVLIQTFLQSSTKGKNILVIKK